MPNSFQKQITQAWEDVVQGFEDGLEMTGLVSKYETDQATMERSNNILWRPQPYILPSFDGADQTANFKDQGQLSVPSTIGFRKAVPWQMTDTELLDALQEKNLGEAARIRVASDINVSVINAIDALGSLYVKRSAAAGSFEDVAQVDSLLNEQGIQRSGRQLVLNSRDYNAMANDLSKASRSLDNPTSTQALRDAFVGKLSGIDTYKLDYSLRQTAAAGVNYTATTLAAGVNKYVPVATRTATTGEMSPVDNRTMIFTLAAGSGVAVGDRFTIADVFAVHHITKLSTGSLKQFKVVRVISATSWEITPPLIDAAGSSEMEVQYGNVRLASTSATAALVFLNTVAAPLNYFFTKESIVLIPGRIAPPSDGGMQVMRATTKQGIEITMTKQANIQTAKTFFRFDCRWGVTNLQPEMTGAMAFSQT